MVGPKTRAAGATAALRRVTTILLLVDEFLLFLLDFVVFRVFGQNENLLRFFDAFLQPDRSALRFVLSCVKDGNGLVIRTKR